MKCCQSRKNIEETESTAAAAQRQIDPHDERLIMDSTDSEYGWGDSSLPGVGLHLSFGSGVTLVGVFVLVSVLVLYIKSTANAVAMRQVAVAGTNTSYY